MGTGQPAPVGAAPKTHDLGVLLVHGIGLQARADTMVHWGEELRKCLGQWISGATGGDPADYVDVADALVREDPADLRAPAHSKWAVTVPTGQTQERHSTWLVAESWWADSFATPRFADLASWSSEILPWTLVSHFGTRLRRAVDRLRSQGGVTRLMMPAMAVLPELAYFLVGLALIPLVVSLLLLLLVIGLIPITKVRSVAGAFQRTLAGTVGDSFVLLDSPIQAAAITGHVRRDLEWLAARCKRVAVVAHSQGAAISHAVLRSGFPAEVGLFVSVGSGLNKLSEIRRVKETEQKWLPWLALTGFLVAAVCAPGVLHLVKVVNPLELVASFVLYLIFATLALRVLQSKVRLHNWFAALLGLLAFAPIAYSIRQVMSRAEPMAYAFAAGTALFVKAVLPAIKRKLDTEEFRQRLRLRNIRWLDFYAASDPVPNGPLIDGAPDSLIETQEVHNQGSALSDHTAYWKNHDAFVTQVALSLARLAGFRLDRLTPWDEEFLEVAGERRRWRVGWLKAARIVLILLAGIVVYGRWQDLSSIVTALPPGVVPAAYWVGQMAQKLKLVPDSVSFHGGEQANQWIGVGTVVLGAFLVYGALSLLWKWWNAAELKVFFARGEFPIFSLPFGVFCFVLSLACECALLLAGGWARRAPPNLFPTLAAVVIAAGLSIAWRFIRTLTKEDWTSAFHEHGAVWAGRAAVATVVVLPGIIWDDRVYGNVLPPDSGVFTGPVSGFCLLVWLLAALLCGPASRMRAGVWLRRRVEAWSQAGSKQDVLERHAAQLVADGAAVQDILERLKNDPSLKGDPKLIRVERNIRMVLRRLAGRAMRVARQLDPAARQEQIDDVSRFRDAVMPVRRPAHSARP